MASSGWAGRAEGGAASDLCAANQLRGVQAGGDQHEAVPGENLGDLALPVEVQGHGSSLVAALADGTGAGRCSAFGSRG